MNIDKNIDIKIINNIRMLGLSSIQRANSGHPGIVLGLAPVMYILYKKFLNINVKVPEWINRDRIILSAGHGSALLYATMFFAGYSVSINDLKNFRQFNSKTPGHPEYWIIPGIETTTGPLGQGLATSVGMAIAEKYLENKFSSKNNIINNFTYVICGDGDLQEGISYESMSIAGYLKLNKLVVLYDSNGIQLDSKTDTTFNENIKSRVESQKWEYFIINDGNNLKEIEDVIAKAINSKIKKPKFIEVKTIIGYGSSLANTNKVHGAPFSVDEYKKIKKFFNYNHDKFYYDNDLKNYFKNYIYTRSIKKYNLYKNELKENKIFSKFIYDSKNININAEALSNALFNEYSKGIFSSRKIFGIILKKINLLYDNLLGGSADLSSSTRVLGADGNFNSNNLNGRNIMFGVREHSMAAICNGLNLYKPIRFYCSTFLCFSDYLKPSLRLASLSKIPSIFIFSHDSIFLGEDGPTHQPIEQISNIRNTIGVNLWRPANLIECIYSLKFSIESKFMPNVIITSREKFIQETKKISYKEYIKGGYVFSEDKNYEILILFTGSQISQAINIKKILNNNHNINVKLVSVTCLDILLEQDSDYKNMLFSNYKKPIFVIEASNCSKWLNIIHSKKYFFGVDNYSKSGKYCDILKNSFLDINYIIRNILNILNK